MYTPSGFGNTPGVPAPESGLPPEGGPPPRGGRSLGKVAAVVVTCAVVAGGAFAVTQAVSTSGPTPSPAPSAAALSAPTGQAAVLNGALADLASSSTPATPAPTASAAAARRVSRALVRLRALGGMYGQYTFETKKGPRTLGFERGTILSIAGADVTVKATDGTTWTWVLTGATIVRENGSRTTATNLADGQLVFAAGQVTGTARDARLVVIREAAKQQAA
jgi:hypothetical protein